MTRNELARLTDVSGETIRYYEKRGLIPPPERTESGYRIYTPNDVSRVQFIKRAQGLGFSLKEISELLDFRVDDDCSCDEVKERVEEKIHEVEQKLDELTGIKTALARLAMACEARSPTDRCPILQALDDGGTDEADG